MTNPNNAVGTNGAYNGRTSVNAFNDIMGAFTKGVVSGWNCTPKSGMTVSVGGDGSTRDVAIAEDNADNKTSINNISGQPIDVTIPAAPATGNRIDLIVAYVENPPQGDPAQVDNFQACGLITVSGTAAASPVAPSDTTIRNAITSDGATGATAYYVILAQVTVGTGVTTIGSGVITQGTSAQMSSDKIDFATWYKEVTTSTSIGTSETTVLSISDIPPGRYLVTAQAQLRGTFSSANALEGNSYIYNDNTSVISTFGSVVGSGVNRVQLPLSCQVVKTTTGTISLKMRGGAGSGFFTDGRTNLSIVKIG